MLRLYFCLDCENEFMGEVDDENCPACNSPNVMEDNEHDGHFEGDMRYGPPNDEVMD